MTKRKDVQSKSAQSKRSTNDQQPTLSSNNQQHRELTQKIKQLEDELAGVQAEASR